MFWTTAVLGWAVIAWGVAGVVRHHVDTRPADLLRFVAGGILLHDLVVVPLALVGAYLLNRAVPVPWRRWVQVTLVVAAPLALFAYPMVRGFGRIPGNPTVLPHDYATNLALVVTAVVAIVAALATTHRRRPRPSRRTAVPPASESSGGA
ncbi:MAG: hypothetical protein H0V52_10830 [Acidimicrobiia bacterium]|nr:hypothetical protein [Acidimicrobiia bacterium]